MEQIVIHYLDLKRSSNKALISASKNGHLYTLLWAKRKGIRIPMSFCFAAAAENIHMHILKWILEQGYPWSFSHWRFQLTVKHIPVLQWLQQQGYTLSPCLLKLADREVYQWLDRQF